MIKSVLMIITSAILLLLVVPTVIYWRERARERRIYEQIERAEEAVRRLSDERKAQKS